VVYPREGNERRTLYGGKLRQDGPNIIGVLVVSVLSERGRGGGHHNSKKEVGKRSYHGAQELGKWCGMGVVLPRYKENRIGFAVLIRVEALCPAFEWTLG